MRNSTLLCRRGLMGIALQARHLNENLENNLQLEFFPCLPCVPWIIIIGSKTEFIRKQNL